MKRVIIAGFGIGVAAGATFLALSHGQDQNASHEVTAEHAQTQPSEAPAKAQYDPLGPAGDKTPNLSRYDRMVADVARSQGGEISIGQMMALAEIESRLNGGSPEPYRASRTRMPRSEVSDTTSLLSDFGRVGDVPNSPRVTASFGQYRGSSGAQYEYDLSDPSDRLRYSVDPQAQLMDSIDPRVELDRSLGQYGGGIKR